MQFALGGGVDEAVTPAGHGKVGEARHHKGQNWWLSRAYAGNLLRAKAIYRAAFKGLTRLQNRAREGGLIW